MTTAKNRTAKPIPTTRAILEYVLKHGDAYPLADDDLLNDIAHDLPEAVLFDEEHWTTCSKTAWAAHNDVEPPQVSRWIAHGLPVRPDGRLNMWEAGKWLDDFYEEYKRCTGRDIKAEKLRKTMESLRMRILELDL